MEVRLVEGFCGLITEKCNINFAGNIRTCAINCLTFVYCQRKEAGENRTLEIHLCGLRY